MSIKGELFYFGLAESLVNYKMAGRNFGVRDTLWIVVACLPLRQRLLHKHNGL